MFSEYLCHWSEKMLNKNIFSFILHMTTLLCSWNIMLMQSDTITVEKTSHTPWIFCQRFMTVAACYTVHWQAKSKQRRRHVSCVWRRLMLQRNWRYLYLWKGVANERCLCWNTSLCDCYQQPINDSKYKLSFIILHVSIKVAVREAKRHEISVSIDRSDEYRSAMSPSLRNNSRKTKLSIKFCSLSESIFNVRWYILISRCKEKRNGKQQDRMTSGKAFTLRYRIPLKRTC